MYNVASSTKLSASSLYLRHLGTKLIVTPLGFFMAWLTLHTHLAYLVLFAGAFLEALVGPSFFIPGELFLLSGSILAGAGVLDIWLVLVGLYTGAILGDTSSYFIGRRIGTSIFHEDKKFLNFKNYKKVEDAFEKYGLKAIFFARLVGPFSKVAPVLSGIFEVPFKKFLLYNIPGVIVGCGEFIVVGYFFGDRYQAILWIVERYAVLTFLIVFGLIFGYHYFGKKHIHRLKHHVFGRESSAKKNHDGV